MKRIMRSPIYTSMSFSSDVGFLSNQIYCTTRNSTIYNGITVLLQYPTHNNKERRLHTAIE